jgi:glycosyltransferase involved in cell wall biosynthesis
MQTYSNIEILVIDDASTDNTQEILKKYTDNPKIKIFKNEENFGISKSRNKGVSLATGEYIAMLDSDDYWIDNRKLEKQLEIFNSNPDIGVVGSSINLVREDGSLIKEKRCYIKDNDIRSHMLTKNGVMQSSVIFKKKIFDEVGGYDEDLDVVEDLDLFLKIGKQYKFANLYESTVNYLVHTNNISKSKLKMAITVDKIIEKYKRDYPNYWKGKIVSVARILKSWF